MIAHKRTMRPKQQPASIQTKQLAKLAQQVFTFAQRQAYEQGIRDAETSTRDHPPYGFSDLRDAWRAGWLEASQRREHGK